MIYLEYGKKEIDYLKERDPILGAVIDELGMIEREVNPDIFSALISSVIGQQISTSAATTVKKRFADLVGEVSAENIISTEIDLIQKCGMSMRKAEYIRGIAEAAISKTVDFENLHKYEDDLVMKKLVSLRGVGEWTAEMLLIHSLRRPDIVSYKDLAIRRGMMRLYGLDDLTKKEFEEYRERYSPYGTVASIYLWEIS